MALIGTKLDPFEVNAFQAGQNCLCITERDFVGKWSILCFYPADFTFVCPTELEDLQAYYDVFKSMNAEVYSISTDTHYAHRAWHVISETIRKVRYIMISDAAHVLSKAFNVLNTKTGMAERAFVIIDPDGVIQMVDTNSDSIGRDASLLVDRLRSCQFAYDAPREVFPAGWQEGDPTIKPSIDLVGKI